MKISIAHHQDHLALNSPSYLLHNPHDSVDDEVVAVVDGEALVRVFFRFQARGGTDCFLDPRRRA